MGSVQMWGAVGAKLYYPDDTVQYAGVVIGLGAHLRCRAQPLWCVKGKSGYMGRLYYAQDVSAVTGACLLVRKALFDELNGLDERFTAAFNDVDFACASVRRALVGIQSLAQS